MADAQQTEMQEECEARRTIRFDLSTNSHRPSSAKSQEISHMLSSLFKDIYTRDSIGKDTLSNLSKTNKGRSSYHAKYVKELQEIHSEYSQRTKETDMLESHNMRARAQAEACERMLAEMEVRSDNMWCVDKDFLKRNNLICLQDCLPTKHPLMKAPAEVKPNVNRPTIASNMRVSGQEWDIVIPDIQSKKQTHCGKPKKAKTRPKWMDEPRAEDRSEGMAKLQMLREPHNFLRNPRFIPPDAPQGVKSLIRPQTKAGKPASRKRRTKGQRPTDVGPVPIFLPNPSVVFFTTYSVGHVYETTLELKNVTSSCQHVRVIPPTTSYFSIGLGRFPGEGGSVAPGMGCKYTVRFAPDSLADYADFLVVETLAEQPLVVPIEARRPPPILSLPRLLDCGYCLVGGVKFVEILCRNVGLSVGTFCIIPKNQWPASNLRSALTTCFTEQPPFAVSPSFFVLQPGETTVMEVVFFPIAADRSWQVFTIVSDNCQVKDITVKGEGQRIALDFVSVSGEMEPPAVGEVHDLTAEHFIRFSPCNPSSTQQKTIVIRNNVHLELPFHWQIMHPNLLPLLPGEDPLPSHIQFHLATDEGFSISPLSGTLAPCQDQEFLLTFSPKELKDYHSVCHLVLNDVPQLPPEQSDNGAPQPLRSASKLTDIITMEIEVKGSTEPYQVLLEPYAIIIPGEVLMCTTIHRQFKMWNHSKSCICFQWERLDSRHHIIEVEPSTGKVEENECLDFDLVVTGGKPERVATTLTCRIENHHKPISLAVEVSFRGPVVILSKPNVDFGLLRPGDQTQTSLLLTNTTHLEACWMLEERLNSQQDPQLTQIFAEPCRGVLPPMATCNVDLHFRPHTSQHLETVLELTVEDGRGCHLSVQAHVQTPQVCLLSCQLLLSDLFLGVPAQSSVTLFNQTLLSTHFSWTAELLGKQAELCSASFEPSSGTVGPNASMEVTVTFTSHTDMELTEVAAVCEVQGMETPLVLGIVTRGASKLYVSYSLLSVCSASGDKSSSSSLVLDFGDVVVMKTAVTKQLEITNQTAITAPFTIGAGYFTGLVPDPDDQSQTRSTYVRKPLHPAQAEKLEEKARQEFASSLLAHGKGAAFFVLPETGTLGPFETQTVDITAYADMWGKYRDRLICKVGDLEPRLIPIQMTVTGCPLYFQMSGPHPHDQTQGPTVRFSSHVSGGDTVSRSVRINNPSPCDIRLDWETYNVEPDDDQLLDVVVIYGDAFPLKDADGNVVLDGAARLSDGATWDSSHTPTPERTSFSRQSPTDTDEEQYRTEDECEEEGTCIYPHHEAKKLITVHPRPHRGNLSDYPYCITPQQVVIPARGSGSIHVSFTPLTLSGATYEASCVGVALGFMSLDDEMAVCVPGKVGRVQGLDLEPIRVDLQAAVKPAVLVVKMEDDEGVLEFHASAGDLLRGEPEELDLQDFDVAHSFHLKNTTEVPLHFRLGSRPPFSVLQPQPQPRAHTGASSNPPTSEAQLLVLQPHRSMQVKVAFHCSMSLLYYVDLSDDEVPPGISLVQTNSGRRKLRFQQNLVIHYSNNTQQTVPLCAHLEIANVHLSTEFLDFGTCYVGDEKVLEVNLCGQGAHTHWTAAIEADVRDSLVFRVTPRSGLLRSTEPHVFKFRQLLHVGFTASEDREFMALLIIQPLLVKTPLTLLLRGRGSFDEAYDSNYLKSSPHYY
ncbi:deleted in lung and esophageal cancer protein 1 [Genypterus blacodes]|uniref:deleted in lung and esophageal cancer protein 1 n=1 Tax=Genypterus blacodes TaxID=154954 RepID=UPI003F7682F1